MSAKLFLLLGLIGIIQLTSCAPQVPGSFTSDLFGKISKTKTTENVILSPLSVQTALAMTYLGAEGVTASELQKGLRLQSSNKEEVGRSFAEILKEKKGEAQLNIANRLFVNSNYQLQSSFNDRARKYFNSEAETVNFSQSSDAIKTINTWVEQKTNNKITNLMQPGSVDGDTSAIIVNAIYFKGKWETPFSTLSTSKQPFWISETKSVNVDTMSAIDQDFKYGELPELDATAIEMPYEDSDISMIIILPKARNGLATLEEKLSLIDINQLSSRLRDREISVRLPKFKIETSIGLVDVLKELGIRSIFDNTANLSGIFESGPAVKVSDVQQKAFIDVNEAGSEAAAASFMQLALHSMGDMYPTYFIADHPFVFAIRSPELVYFVGHVATF